MAACTSRHGYLLSLSQLLVSVKRTLSRKLSADTPDVADYVQRDLADCHAKLGLVQDANSAYSKGRGTVMCEEFYLPTQDELSSESFRSDSQNRFLARTPP